MNAFNSLHTEEDSSLRVDNPFHRVPPLPEHKSRSVMYSSVSCKSDSTRSSIYPYLRSWFGVTPCKLVSRSVLIVCVAASSEFCNFSQLTLMKLVLILETKNAPGILAVPARCIAETPSGSWCCLRAHLVGPDSDTMAVISRWISGCSAQGWAFLRVPFVTYLS